MLGGGSIGDLQEAIVDDFKTSKDTVMTAANRAQAYGSEVWANTKFRMPNIIDAEILPPNEALKHALESYGKSIDLNSHSILRFPAFVYPTREHLYKPYIYEYLAYRFTIYHDWFRGAVWTFYSSIPYFISEKKNSILLRDLVPYSPTVDIRDSTVQLVKLWNRYEIQEDLKLAESKYKTQMMYLERLRLDLLRRLDLFRSAYNYSVLKVLLTEVKRCPHRDKVKTCMSKAQELLFTDFSKSDYPLNFDTETKGEQEDIDVCTDPTNVVIPAIWDETVKANELKNPGVDFQIDSSKIADFDDNALQDNFEEGVEKLEEAVNVYKQNSEIKTALTLNHVLPDICQCLFRKIKKMQRNRVNEQMEEIRNEWMEQATSVETTHQEIRTHMNMACFNVLKQTGDENSECTANLNELQNDVEMFLKQVVENVATPSESTIASFWKETYPPFYSELEELHERYVSFFGNFLKIFNDLVSTLEGINESKVSYDRAIAQLDYIADAYISFADIAVPLDLIALEPRPETNIVNYKSVVSNLATLCDILEDKIFRGYVSSNTFPFRPVDYQGEKDLQEYFLKLVEGYSPSKGESAENRQLFLDAFVGLDPEYVLHHSDAKNLLPMQAQDLFEKAKKYCSEGKFARGIHTCYLIFLFPLSVLSMDRPMYIENKHLLEAMLHLTGHKTTLIRELPWPPTEYSRNQVLIRFQGTTDDKNIPNLVKQELGDYNNAQSHFAKFIASKFKYVGKADMDIYNRALVNYLCLQFYTEGMPTRKVLKYPKLGAKEFAKILHFFPEKHVGRFILSNVRDALLDDHIDQTCDFIADFLVKYQVYKRKALDQLPQATNSKKLKRDLLKTVGDIDYGIRSLKYTALIVESAKYEREENWPKRGAGSTFLRMAAMPYVDGNYTINVKVDVVLSAHDTDTFSDMNCDDKLNLLHDMSR